MVLRITFLWINGFSFLFIVKYSLTVTFLCFNLYFYLTLKPVDCDRSATPLMSRWVSLFAETFEQASLYMNCYNHRRRHGV